MSVFISLLNTFMFVWFLKPIRFRIHDFFYVPSSKLDLFFITLISVAVVKKKKTKNDRESTMGSILQSLYFNNEYNSFISDLWLFFPRLFCQLILSLLCQRNIRNNSRRTIKCFDSNQWGNWEISSITKTVRVRALLLITHRRLLIICFPEMLALSTFRNL